MNSEKMIKNFQEESNFAGTTPMCPDNTTTADACSRSAVTRQVNRARVGHRPVGAHLAPGESPGVAHLGLGSVRLPGVALGQSGATRAAAAGDGE